MAAAEAGLPAWAATPVEERAAALERAADALERERGRLIALLQVEGGKTLDDALAEVREAVDFCRYYAAEARRALAPSRCRDRPARATSSTLSRPRRVRLHQPVEFPARDLPRPGGGRAGRRQCGRRQAGRADAADRRRSGAHSASRPALPTTALHLVPGDGRVGAALVADPRVAGVVFTGSTEVARAINRALARKDGPIVPLIAETGGINAMIVDATALPEQVTDDVVTSAFRSAGQRCSALRLLAVQEDVADRMIAMIEGAARELKLGDPRDPSTHVGPVIDAEAKERLDRWIADRQAAGARALPLGPPCRCRRRAPTCRRRSSSSTARATSPRRCSGRSCTSCAGAPTRSTSCSTTSPATATALTLGIHSRIDATVERIVARLANGNVYVNRSMIGAVVGTQPFGGTGLSGTGPKAGGPELSPALRHRAGGDDQHRGGRRQCDPAGGGGVAPA